MTTALYTASSNVGEKSRVLQDKLETIWESKPGAYGFVASVDHKEIGDTAHVQHRGK